MVSLHLSPLKLLPTSFHPLTTPPITIPSLRKTPKTYLLHVFATAPQPAGDQRKEEKLSIMIEEKVTEAHKICEENSLSEECVVAWDEVEEVSQAKAHLRQRSAIDPLEAYCRDHPKAPECRIYED
ncbi:calvin cycle protein CP12-3, chloroplastic-like [Magnolia sinica]|uniref:calvin cycle protein CP12-3, chloroplastic-like n=1 Tax=Magnolia sinica TaxID=86752 RepID=UPI00265A654B|nr:calvin cycle protein CP12-3, chloroplastic-like [Magnolia sinica]